MGLLDRIRSLTGGPSRDSPSQDAARLRAELVGFYRAGRYTKAVGSTRRLVEIQRRTMVESHSDYAAELQKLAVLMDRRGERDDARKLFERAATIRGKASQPLSLPAPARPSPVAHRDLAVFDRVLALTHDGPGMLDGLRECQDSARSHREAISEGDPTASDSSRFAALISLVDNRDTLNNAQWAEAYEAVSTTFGRSLASAATKGRLRVAVVVGSD